jgi:hypothetical protein
MATSTTFTFKTIKTPRMNIQPTRRLIQAAVQAEAKYQKRQLEKTVQGWKSKPRFKQEVTSRDPDLIVTVGPDTSKKEGAIWEWINDGTPARTIRAKRKPYLVFNQNYSPATRPGQFSSTPSGSWGPKARKRSVKHPGIKARDWTNVLSKKRQRPFRDRIFKAIRTGANQLYP